MNRKGLIVAIVVLGLSIWLYRWCQPERQVRRAQARLLAAAESGDFDSMAELIAEDYRDAWGHDKTFVLQASKRIFPHFLLLDFERDDRGLEEAGSQWVLREKLTMKAMGGPPMVISRVNRLTAPFTMTWRKNGWQPWAWELTSLEHPELAASEMEMHW